MSDIATRLRQTSDLLDKMSMGMRGDILREAADEIERLTQKYAEGRRDADSQECPKCGIVRSTWGG